MRTATQPDGGPSATWGAAIAHRARAVAELVAWKIAYPAITPNVLTVVGFVLTVGVAFVIGSGYVFLGGVLVLMAGLFDMLDGAMARITARKTRFGAFLDSTLDRYSEAALLGGVLWLYKGADDGAAVALLVLIVLAGSLMVSYTRARAEAINIDCEVGWLPRPQRIVLLSLGLITGYVVYALAALALFTHITTAQRILHVRRALLSR